MRTRKGAARHRAKKRLSRAVKGYWGAKSRLRRAAHEALRRAWRYSWVHRRTKKRDMRSLWITRISAATRSRGTSYSRFMAGLKSANVVLNRKVLSEIAISDPSDFDHIVQAAGSTESP